MGCVPVESGQEDVGGELNCRLCLYCKGFSPRANKRVVTEMGARVRGPAIAWVGEFTKNITESFGHIALDVNEPG